MNKTETEHALAKVREARQQWGKAQTQYRETEEYVLIRLLHEAAINRMSVADVAEASGLTTKRVRTLAKTANLISRGTTTHLLVKTAAAALHSNAEMLEIDPRDMDLTSPLAYLPMGERLKDELREARISRVTELEEPVASGLWCQECEFFEEHEFQSDGGFCVGCGCVESEHVSVNVALA